MKLTIDDFRILSVVGGILMAGVACAGSRFGDLPNATHAWAVHDMHRPNPVKVTAKPGLPPSDAIVLFDGTAESVAKNWCDDKGNPTKWVVRDGRFECVPKSGYAQTKEKFGDCQLHIEWYQPTNLKGEGQARGNSGVIFMGKYEIQVLDSYETDPAVKPMKNPNYADGQAGAVYGQNPPTVNPSRPAGEWQTYDVVFHPPIWQDGKLVDPGAMTCFFNGVLVQDYWELEGVTHWRQRPHPEDFGPEGVFKLQDHGNPVSYRNIWIRRIPSRYANHVHGGPNVKPAEVVALREKVAKELFAKLDRKAVTLMGTRAALEVLFYSKKPEYVAYAESCMTEVQKQLAALDAKTLKSRKDEVIALWDTFITFDRSNDALGQCACAKFVAETAKKQGWKLGR